MKNLIIAIFAIATLTSLTSCGKTNDPGYQGPCNNGGGNGQGNNGGGQGNGGGGINTSETFDAFVYGLPANGRISVDSNGDGSNDMTVDAHQNLYGDLNSQCFNLCPQGYTKRAIVVVYWAKNAYGDWIQLATYSGCSSY